MRSALPDDAKISKEVKECVLECVNEFISFITSETANTCGLEKLRTTGGDDILKAMYTLGIENYAQALRRYLERFRESQSTRNDGIPVVDPRIEHSFRDVRASCVDGLLADGRLWRIDTCFRI